MRQRYSSVRVKVIDSITNVYLGLKAHSDVKVYIDNIMTVMYIFSSIINMGRFTSVFIIYIYMRD